MRRFLKIILYFFCLLLLLFVGGYFSLPYFLKKNGITFSEKQIDFPFTLRVKNLKANLSGITATVNYLEINLSIKDLLSGKISGNQLIIKGGKIQQIVTPDKISEESKSSYNIRFKKIILSDINFTQLDNGDTLLLQLPEMLITNLSYNDQLHIDVLKNTGSKLVWNHHEQKTSSQSKDTVSSGSIINAIPVFSINKLSFVDCAFNLNVPNQHHDISAFNLDVNGIKENNLLNISVNNLSLVYQDTLAVKLRLNKVLVNDKDEVTISNLAFDFPLLKLHIPELRFSNLNSPLASVTLEESYVNTALTKFFMPKNNLPIAHDLGINFEGRVTYQNNRIYLDQLALKLTPKSSLTLDGFADLPGKTKDSLQMKIENLRTTSAELEQLFNYKPASNQKQVVINAGLNVTGTYNKLTATGQLALNKMQSNFAVLLDQSNAKNVTISAAINSKRIDPSQILSDLGAEYLLTNFRLTGQVTFNANQNIKSFSAVVKSDAASMDDKHLNNPTVNLSYTTKQTTAKINLPGLLDLTLSSADDVLKNDVAFTGKLSSALPQLTDFNKKAGDFYSRFEGQLMREKNAIDFKLMMDTINFRPADFNEMYTSSGTLSAGKNEEGDLNLQLILADEKVIAFETTKDIYEWLDSNKKLDGNFPATTLDVALVIDSNLVKQFTGYSGEIHIDELRLKAAGNEAKAVINIPSLIYKDYRIRDFNGNIDASPDAINSELIIADFQNPYALLNEIKLTTAQQRDNSVHVELSALLPEINNGFAASCVLSYTDTTYLINLDDKVYQFGNQQWQNYNSGGFLFNKNYDLLAGDLTIVNGEQKINFETAENIMSVKIDSLKLDPMVQVLTNDSLFRGDLNLNATYQLLEQQFIWNGSLNKMIVSEKSLGSVSFDGLYNKEYLSAHAGITEQYGLMDIKVTKDETPLRFDVAIDKLDLNYLNTTLSPYQSMLPVSGQLNAKVKGSYDEKITADGYISFDKVESYLTENKIYLRTDNDTIVLKNTEALFDNFKLLDKKGNNIAIDGSITMEADPQINLKIKSKEFEILDPANKGKNLKGSLSVATDLDIKHQADLFKISGSFAVLPGANLSYLYESSVSLDEREKEMTFVSFSEVDSLNNIKIKPAIKGEQSKPIDYDIKLDVGKSTFVVILSETSQDQIKMTADGSFLLKAGVNAQPYFYGTLKSNEGSFVYDAPMVSDLNMNIEKVQVNWNGDLMEPKITFLGSEPFRVAAKGIPGMSASSIVPINVLARIDDRSINDFELKFDVNSDNTQVKGWIQSLPQDSREACAINLLLFGNLNFGETTNGSMMQTLVSKMNEISRRNIKNADLSFYVNNENVDESSTETKDLLGVNFSKKIFNDKVKVSVGGSLDFSGGTSNGTSNKVAGLSSFQLEYSLATDPDIALDMAYKYIYDGAINGQINVTSFGVTYLKKFHNFFKPIPKNQTKL